MQKAKVRLQEAMERFKGFIGEPFDTKVEICENGVHYIVDVEHGQKTGFFLDQKYNRLAVQNLCRNLKPAKVLDCFTPYLAAFALNAGIARESEKSPGGGCFPACRRPGNRKFPLKWLRDDHVTFQCADCIRPVSPKLEQEGEKFDVVIL